jgi:hypothetical protein
MSLSFVVKEALNNDCFAGASPKSVENIIGPSVDLSEATVELGTICPTTLTLLLVQP